MIPEIGLIIGGYVIMRCISFITRNGDREEHTSVQIMAGIGILATALICLDLMFGHHVPQIPALP